MKDHKARIERLMRVLIADDNEINREFLFGVLANQEYQIAQARDGREAVDLCRSGTFDAILMDIRMPAMDGIEATAAIRAMDRHHSTVIIALTADLQVQRQNQLLERGFDATMAKPVSREDLIATLDRLCAQPDPVEKPSADQPMDMQRALAAAGGNQALVDKLTGMLLRELARFAEPLESARKNEDMETAREMAHKLRASAGYCGAVDLGRAAQAVEEACKDTDKNAFTIAMSALRRESERLQRFVGTP